MFKAYRTKQERSEEEMSEETEKKVENKTDEKTENAVENKPESNKKMAKSTKAVIAVSSVAIVGLTAAVIVLAMNKPEPQIIVESGTTVPPRAVLVDKENLSEVLEQLTEERMPEGRYRVRMNTTWHFNKSDEPSYDAHVSNDESNTHDVYFDLVLDETEETIYSSPVIPLGKTLDEVKLEKMLRPGTYVCTLTYHLIDENQVTVSTLNISVNIVIEG